LAVDRELAKAHVTISSRQRELEKAFDEIEKRQDRTAAAAARANKGMRSEYSKTVKEVDKLTDALDRSRRTTERLGKEGKVSLQVEKKTLKDLDDLEKRIDRMDGKDIHVTTELLGDMEGKLLALDRSISRVDGRHIRISSDLDAAGTLVELELLEQKVDALDGRRIEFTVSEKTRSSIGSAGLIFDIVRLKLTLMFAKLPPMIALLGQADTALFALSGTLVQLLAPLTSVVGEIGNLGGAFLTAAPAATTLHASLAVLATAFVPLALVIKSNVTEANKVATAFLKASRSSDPAAMASAQKAYEKLSGTQKLFVPIQLAANRELLKFNEYLSKPAARVWGNLLTTAFATLNNVKGGLKESAIEVANLSEQFKDLVGTSRFQGFFQQVIKLGGYMVRTLGPSALGLVDSFRAIFVATLPNVKRFTNAISDVFDRFSKLTLRSERNGKLQEVFDNAWKAADKLGEIIGNVGHAIFTWFRASEEAGDGLLTKLVELTDRFDNWMTDLSKSGELQKFAEDSSRSFNGVIELLWQMGRVLGGIFKAALPSGNSLIAELTNWFEDLADSINSIAGQKGIQEFFEEMAPVAELLGETLQIVAEGMFEVAKQGRGNLINALKGLNSTLLPKLIELFGIIQDSIGPVINEILIEKLTAIITIMGDAQGPVHLFLVFLRELLGAFELLPHPIQLVVANFIAFQTILRVFFDTQLLTLMTSALSDMYNYFRKVAVASRSAGVGVALFGTAAQSVGNVPLVAGFRSGKAARKAKTVGGGFQNAEQLALLGGGVAAERAILGGGVAADKAGSKWFKLGKIVAWVSGLFGKTVKVIKSPITSLSRLGLILRGAVAAIAAFAGEITGLTAAGVSLTGVGAIVVAVVAAVVGSVVALATNFGNIRGVIVDLLEWGIQPLIDGFDEIKVAFVDLVESITGGHAEEVAEGAGSAFEKLGDAISFVAEKIGPAIKLFAQVVGFGVLIAIFAPIAVAIRAVAYAFQALAIAIKFLLNIITFLVDQAKKLPQLFNTIKDAFGKIPGVLNTVVNAFKALPGLILEAIKKIPYIIGYVIGTSIKAWLFFVIKSKVIILGFLKDLAVMLATGLAKAAVAVYNFVINARDFFRSLPGKLLHFVKEAVSKVIKFFTSSKGGGRKSVEAFLSGALDFVKSLPSKFWRWAKGAVAAVIRAVKNGAPAVGRAIKGIGEDILQYLKEIPSKIYEAAKDIGKEIAKGIKDGVGDALESIPGVGAVGGALSDAAGAVGGLFAQGGPIPGRGNADSVVIRATPGEHMITKKEVQAAGGHGAIYALRRRLGGGGKGGPEGYAAGGQIQSGIGVGPGLRNLAGSVGSLSSTIKGSLSEIAALVNQVFSAYEATIKKHAKRAADAAVRESERTRDQIKKKLEEAKQATEDKTAKMAHAGQVNFKKISDSADFHFDKTKDSATKKSDKTKDNVVDAASKMAGKWFDNMSDMKDTTSSSFGSILGQTSSILKAFGVDFKMPNMSTDLSTKAGKQHQREVKNQKVGAARGGRLSKLMLGHPLTNFFAEGGRIMGDMIGTLRDVVPAMLGKNEAVITPHQEGFIEQMSGIPGIVDMALGSVQTPNYFPYAKGGRGGEAGKRKFTSAWRGVSPSGLHSGIKKVTAAMLGAFPGLSVTSTTGGSHVAGSYHYGGEATDTGGPTEEMYKASEWLKKTGIYRVLAEGIHNPNLSVADGSLVSPSTYSSVWAGHADHIHLAVTQAVKRLAGFAGGALGGVAGSVPKIKIPKIKAAGGAAAAVAQAAVQKVGAAANKFVQKQAAKTGGLPVMGGSGGNVEAQIYSTLRKNRLNLVGASGIIGNAYAESTLDPSAQGYGGGGLFGFTTPPVSLANLKEFMAKRKLPWTNASGQVVFMLKHLAASLRNRLNASASPEAAASLFMSEWERPGIPRQDVRESAARRAYARFSKMAKGGRAMASTLGRPFARFAKGTSGGASYSPGQKPRNQVQKSKDRLQDELDKLIERIEKQFKGRFESLGKTLIGLVKSITDKEIKALVEEFRRIQKKIKQNFKGAFQDLVKFTGKSLEFTKENIRGISQVVAAIKTFRGLAHRKAPTLESVQKDFEREASDKDLAKFNKKSAKEQKAFLKKQYEEAKDAFVKMRDAAKEALKGARQTLKGIVETIVSSSTEIYEAFNSYLEAGSGLSSSSTSPVTATFDALQGLDKLDYSKVEGFLGQISYWSRTIKDFGRQFLFAKQQVNLSIRELKDLGAQMAFIQKLARKTGSNFKGAVEQVKHNVLATAQAAIDAVNRMYEQAKAELERQLNDEISSIERARQTEIDTLEKGKENELNALEKAHDEKLKLLEDAERDITRAAEREQRRREVALTRRSLGKLLAQEFLSDEDIDQIESLQQQLADQLRANAEAERRYTYEDTIEKINKDFETTREAINERYDQAIDAANQKYDQAIETAQARFAEAMVTLTNQSTAMMDDIIKQAAKALGVKPKQIWDYLLGGGTLQRKVGQDAAEELVSGLLDNPNLFIQAGVQAMQAFLAGANAAATGQPAPQAAVGGGQKAQGGGKKGKKGKKTQWWVCAWILQSGVRSHPDFW
jgi:hypothetical protein